ncbi:MAG: tRNA (adenosine(37)-N6)-dimethylallyltransferase MiaA [Bacteroidetes bacterium]|nr:MAG: tRNA (adenosine(37)-N6)-dimethylallyltransferase MiaA [Bacteroidota bacterium]RLD74438.1 MAG: tRNA (adenosine(37)-N6)-dimethylallyltransferase MiaA [Bacteroidota bacterium]
MNDLITILGVTATGKTRLAIELARILDGEIISADSRQVYKGMDIGTGKDLQEYSTGGNPVPYHLIDIVDPGYEYNVYEFNRDFYKIYDNIVSRGKMPVMCGGSGLYLDSVISGYELKKVPANKFLRKNLEEFDDEELIRKLKSYGPLHNVTDILDRDRLVRAIEIAEFELKNVGEKEEHEPVSSINFGIKFDRETIRNRITERLHNRMENGLIEEVKDLLESGLTPEQLMFYGLEYKYITMHLAGELGFDEMFAQLNIAIHQFAKKQMTWYRRMEKKGVKIHWIDGTINLDHKVTVVMGILRNYQG